MSEYSIKEQFTVGNTLISYSGLVIAFLSLIIMGITFLVKNPNNINGRDIYRLSLIIMSFGILIWEVTYFPRIKYLNFAYSPGVFVLFLSFLPMWASYISPYGILFTNFSNFIAILSNILIFVNILVMIAFLFSQLNKMYFSKNTISKFLTYFTKIDPELQISWVELSGKLQITEKLTELYLRKLVDYNPEFGEYDELNETFKGSNKTISILENIILEIDSSPQEKFISSVK